ncbi:uncharacterized protein J7T55_000720 [Diaporthe amygdali]|uniref:uncharacterized protein n=1 Tax=Phomopsis amygdali TaxID=1214568 RepID=UPI0022FDE83E|nr:uncharacterized protein J7T55_000720 [Diaporthe amygdali]KAJ0110287.1 uncharacterized protein J7T55_000720 [Diaporthe amygdali]
MSTSPSSSAVVPTKRKHRPGLQRIQIACERCRLRKNKRQQPRGHIEELEAEITNLKERVRQLELDISVRDSELASLKQNTGTPPASTAGIPAANSATPCLLSDSDHDRVRREGPVTQNRSSCTSPLLAQVLLSQAAASQEIPTTPGGPGAGGSYSGTAGATETTVKLSVSSSLPPQDTAKQLQEAYFTLRWPALPVLHQPTFVKQHYTNVTQLGNSASHVSIFLTFMVFALGSIDTKAQELTFPDAHLDFFDVAMQHMSGLIHANSLETVQGLLLMTVFAVNERRRINSWHGIGLAVRTAIDLGLHRASTSSSSDVMMMEMQRRVFWSVYALDRNVSISLGRPCSISDADFDVPLPRCHSDEDLETICFSATPLEDQPRNPRDLSTFLHTVELRQIQSKIQRTLYPVKMANAIDTVLLEQERYSLRLALDDWIARAPRYSKPTQATFQSPDWFQIAYSHGLLLLYRPSPACPIISLESLQICADSAISLISSYSSLYAKNKITYTWIALQSLFMASVTMLYTLWVSPEIRKSTRKVVVQSNVRSCLALFDAMEDHWPLAQKFYSIIDRLGQAAVGLFDPNNDAPSPLSSNLNNAAHFHQIDAEYMEWFGTRHASQLQVPSLEACPAGVDGMNAAIETVLSDPDLAATSFNQTDLLPDWGDWFRVGFDMTIPLMTNAFSGRPV